MWPNVRAGDKGGDRDRERESEREGEREGTKGRELTEEEGSEEVAITAAPG